jgi:hypothetical protein
MLVKDSKWFAPDHQSSANMIMDVYTNYKDWKVKAKRQGYYSRTNFSFEKMKEILEELLNHNIPDIAKQVTLNLPKLKKSKTSNTPKLNLPKLKKV